MAPTCTGTQCTHVPTYTAHTPPNTHHRHLDPAPQKQQLICVSNYKYNYISDSISPTVPQTGLTVCAAEMRFMVAEEPTLGILIFILLEHHIITGPLGWNLFPLSVERSDLSGEPEAGGPAAAP